MVVKLESGTKAKRRRTPTGAYSGKTKFDRWLENVAKQGALCEIVLAPPAPYAYDSDNPDNCRFEVTIKEVDRYNVLLVFDTHEGEDDGGTWWIAKDSIKGVAKIT